MKLNKDNLNQLKKCLPPGSISIVLIRLEKRGFIFSRQYIYRCLDPDHRNYNQVIIDEAIHLCIERLRLKNEMETKLNLLKDQQS